MRFLAVLALIFSAFPAMAQDDPIPLLPADGTVVTAEQEAGGAAAMECAPPSLPGIENLQDEKLWAGCDIYSRRFLYRTEQQAFRSSLDMRRANYVAVYQAPVDKYKQDLEAHHLSLP